MKNATQYPCEAFVTSVLINDCYQYAYENVLNAIPVKTKNPFSFESLVITVLMNDNYQYSYETAVANSNHEQRP